MRTFEQRRTAREAHWRDLEAPRRYLVRFVGRTIPVGASSSGEAMNQFLGACDARLMGTHESEVHAERRLGWR